MTEETYSSVLSSLRKELVDLKEEIAQIRSFQNKKEKQYFSVVKRNVDKKIHVRLTKVDRKTFTSSDVTEAIFNISDPFLNLDPKTPFKLHKFIDRYAFEYLGNFKTLMSLTSVITLQKHSETIDYLINEGIKKQPSLFNIKILNKIDKYTYDIEISNSYNDIIYSVRIVLRAPNFLDRF